MAIVAWLDGQVETRRFASRSHAVEFSVLLAMNASAGSGVGGHATFSVAKIEMRKVVEWSLAREDLKIRSQRRLSGSGSPLSFSKARPMF
jgi:hypothetical protein